MPRTERDPTMISVQGQCRMPWWYREQLLAEADALGVNLSTLMLDALHRVYPPRR